MSDDVAGALESIRMLIKMLMIPKRTETSIDSGEFKRDTPSPRSDTMDLY